ncbi:MAG: hypothetical protein AAF747_04765 [Planctomycetota bacterium]
MAAGPGGPTAFIASNLAAPVAAPLHDAESADRSAAFGLNRHGDVVGMYEDDGERRAFVWTAETGMIDLNSLLAPGDAAVWTLKQARDINDSRQLVGFGTFNNGTGDVVRAFRLTLAPPASCAADRNGDRVPQCHGAGR